MTSGAAPACQTARDEIFLRRHVEKKPDGSTICFFPLDRLRTYLTKERVKEILDCSCPTCTDDCRAIGNHIKPPNSLLRIVGQSGDPEDTRKTAYSLFSLLIYVRHPILIIGFLDDGMNDYSLELYPKLFDERNLKRYTQGFATDNHNVFEQFTHDFGSHMPQFAVRHMDDGNFSRYPLGTILPFIEEREIGKQKNNEGEWTNIGANGSVYAFKIHPEYNKLRHASDVKQFARKSVIPTTEFAKHLERVNLEEVQNYNDKHIVRLIKAYELGKEMHLIFPLAVTNLDHLLRDPQYGHLSTRTGELESCNAWKQLLGIAKALAKIAGVPTDAAPNGLSRDPNAPQSYGFHFDLKPANILVDEDGTWLITDFGQATFTESTDRTPRVSNRGGTDAYAPPEIDNEGEPFSRRYDIWSFGCIILEVAAYLVLGYDGLKGPKGLDRVRRSYDGWSRRRSDDRFFYRPAQHAKPQVKPDIVSFMIDLKVQMQNQESRSQEFLADIIKLIEDMLQPAVEDRRDISEVIRILDGAITQASSVDDVGQPLQIGAAPGELPIGAPELGLVKIRHWNRASEKYDQSSLRLFEDLSGNMRFHNLAYNRYPSEKELLRHKDEILPYYAYWGLGRPSGNEPWICFAHSDAIGGSVVPSLAYAFDNLEDARCVHSKLTYQKIEISCSLNSVRVKKYVKIVRRTFNAIVGVFDRDGGIDELQTKLNEGDDLGPATIQLWTEQTNEAAAKRREQQSLSSGGLSSKRKPRTLPHQQPGYRDILPRRAVIYLHNYGSVLTVKMDVKWIVRVENDKIARFQPCKPEQNPHFETSLIQPTHRAVAGLPLSPEKLRWIESEHCFEADQFELHFDVGSPPDQFNKRYRQMKRSWENEKEEIEKLQGFTPLEILPEPYPPSHSPGFEGQANGKGKGKEKARHSLIQEYHPPEAVHVGKGKERAVELDTPQHHNGYANGYGTPRSPVESNNQSAEQQQRRSSIPQTTPTQLLSHTRTRSDGKVKQSKSYGAHRGGGRGVPPKLWRMSQTQEGG